MSCAHGVAIIDIDGTLLPGTVGLSLLDTLVAQGVVDARRCAAVNDVVDAYRRGDRSYDEMAVQAGHAYALAVAGVGKDVLANAASTTWAHERTRLFDFVRPMMALFAAHSVSPVLVSSSPHDVVAVVADDLGVASFYGSRFAVDIVRNAVSAAVPGAQDRKSELVQRIMAAERFATGRSFAMGNSVGDMGALQEVAHPIAFEPDAELYSSAIARGWVITDRHDVLARIEELL